MENVCVAFDVLGDGVMPSPDHQYIHCHMIFDVKMEDFSLPPAKYVQHAVKNVKTYLKNNLKKRFFLPT
jgi:hypothetical protein